MSDAGVLYREIILRHSRESPHERRIDLPRTEGIGTNPLCGDEVTISIRVEKGLITAAGFAGEGCALSRASASLLCEAVSGRRIDEAERLGETLRSLLAQSEGSASAWDELGNLAALSAASGFPARHRCVTLAWSAFREAVWATRNG